MHGIFKGINCDLIIFDAFLVTNAGVRSAASNRDQLPRMHHQERSSTIDQIGTALGVTENQGGDNEPVSAPSASEDDRLHNVQLLRLNIIREGSQQQTLIVKIILAALEDEWSEVRKVRLAAHARAAPDASRRCWRR